MADDVRRDVVLSREDFIEHAKKSDCSKVLSDTLKDQPADKVEDYKAKVFGSIYDTIGQDRKLASDLESALIVKNKKFEPWQVCLLNVVSCGLFMLIRPQDDDAVLVLTKQGRVITLKMEREGCISGSMLEIVLMFAKYLIILAIALSLPSLVMWIILSGHAQTKSFEKSWGLSEVDRLQIDTDMLEKLKRHYIMGAETFMVFVLVLCFYIWTKCPSDYGNRYRESYAASNCSAGQMCISGTAKYRQVVMRLYFGKFPTQAMLDQHGTTARTSGSVCQVLPLSSLAAAGSTGAGSKDAKRLKRPSQGMMTAGIVVLLSVTTMMDTTLSWFDRAMAASELVKVSEFCRDAKGPDEPGAREYCSEPVCETWAKEHELGDGFCRNVHWHDNNRSKSQLATCLTYGYATTPCCGGCGMGDLYNQAKAGGWLAGFQEVLGIIADIGTLVFSFMAATAAVAADTTADHFDVTIHRVRSNDSLDVESRFDFAYPAAHRFFETVYRKHRMPKEGAEKGEGTISNFMKVMHHAGTSHASGLTESAALIHADVEDDDVKAAGVSLFDKHTKHSDWVDFLSECNLTEPIDGSWFGDRKVIVPVHCLGIIDAETNPKDPGAEHVVAAWSEMPRMQWGQLTVPVVAALLLLFLLIAAPDSVSEEPVVGFGLPDNPIGRVGTALILAFIIVFSGFVATYVAMVVNGITHAVVVTDQRIFYIRHQGPFYLFCKFGMSLRVDVFRHDRQVTYGKIETGSRTFWQRLTRPKIQPGVVIVKAKSGILQLSRQYGNVWNVFGVVQQLCSEKVGNILTKELDQDAAWDWDTCQANARKHLEEISINKQRQLGLLHIKAEETDLVGMGPGLYLVTTKDASGKIKEVEEPLFHWRISQAGDVNTAYNTTQDVVVTTGRVYIWNRCQFKTFNCKTALLWGACWCGWLSALTQSESLPSSMSFFTLDSLLSFSTNTSVQPPTWSDPVNGPLRVPLWDRLCAFMTLCMTCKNVQVQGEDDDVEDGLGPYSPIPKRRAPLVQLFLMWRLKTGPQQADLMCSVFPFQHKDFDDVDLMTSLNCMGGAGKKEDKITEHSRKVTELRAIMGVAQDAAESR